ncbi:hypothetical protein ACFQ8T_04500 [Isoptericola sp. NPDC056618]|uniref:hypothetical protein n=1 Tax=Isoptericola sp. NPDC056618 TaxID=3345878 RepID=UPI0036CCDC4B
MISTRVFSRQRSIWANLAPTLEPVVRWANENYTEFSDPVPANGGEPANNALIAEAAFGLVASGRSWDSFSNADLRIVREYVLRVGEYPMPATNLDAEELEEVRGLARSLGTNVSLMPTIEFWPEIPGCGVVDSARGDILSGLRLLEVKCVTRPFRSGDFRQLLTYCAMYAASGVEIESVGIVNPRTGREIHLSVEFVCRGSSGLTSVEFFREVQRTMLELQVSG